jgi:hypothetical protein
MIKFFNYRKILSTTAIREGGRNPYVDWVVILFITVISFIALILGGISLYDKVRNGEIEAVGNANNSQMKTFNQKDLKYIIEKYNIKSENINTIKTGFSVIPDPSK